MRIVIDTSALIAVITNEPHKKAIVNITQGIDLIAPTSIPCEIANAFSAMFKQKRISLKDSLKCVEEYMKIPIRFFDLDLKKSIEISFKHNIYAYDALLISCCLSNDAPLLTLDMKLLEKAKEAGVKTLEV